MSEKPISPMRQRMIDDTPARRFTKDTQRDYVRHVRNFTVFLGRSPDTATSEELRRYQLHLAKQQIGTESINATCTVLRFFFKITLEKARPLRHLALCAAGHARRSVVLKPGRRCRASSKPRPASSTRPRSFVAAYGARPAGDPKSSN